MKTHAVLVILSAWWIVVGVIEAATPALSARTKSRRDMPQPWLGPP